MSSSKSEDENRSEPKSCIDFDSFILPLKDAIGLPRPLRIQSISSSSGSYSSLSTSLPNLSAKSSSSSRSYSSFSTSLSDLSSSLYSSSNSISESSESYSSTSGTNSSSKKYSSTSGTNSSSKKYSSTSGTNSSHLSKSVQSSKIRDQGLSWKDISQESFKSEQPPIFDKRSESSDWSSAESKRDESPKRYRSKNLPKYERGENPRLKKITHCYPEYTHIPSNERSDKFCILVSIFFLFIISWIIIQFWNRFFLSLYFRTFCFDENSTYDIFVAAVSITLILLIILYFAYSVGDRALCRFVGTDPDKKDYECRICPVTRNY